MTRSSLTRRSCAAALSAVAVVLAGPVSAVADTPPTTTVPAEAAAGWLARQLVDGERMETVFDGVAYPDQGLTADTVLALDAAGVAQEFAAKATAWLAKPDILAGYLGGTDSYAGPHAKLALVAAAQGVDPTAFGGVDLVAGLTALQAPSGRFSDKSGFGDFSNGITQSLAVIALERHATAPVAAVDYLVGTQCADGGFPLYLEQTPCMSDVDTTGFAVQALLAAARTAAAGEALDWLETVQQTDGGFAGSGPTTVVNANSTGLAAQALHAGQRTVGADNAVEFLASLQVGCTGAGADRGAIAYDETGFSAANAIRSTTQAILGITGVGLTEVSAEGAVAPAPVLDCATPTTTPTTTTTTVTTTSATTPGTTTSDTTPVTTTTPVAGGTTPTDLASTGANVGPAVGLGAMLLIGGLAVVLLARQRRTRR
ncbi:peptidase [Actinokineospora sp.]|uniref:peptidase n=1 Tax=Actinokineospora sp. TaxID=1872133 RepID=UPI004037CD40